MAKSNDVDIKITVDSKKATTDIKKTGEVGKDAAKKIEIGFKSSTSAIKVMQGVLGANVISAGFNLAARAGREFFGVMKDSIDAAIIQENALNDLSAAMKRSGEYTTEAYQDMQDFASSLQKSTKYGDEAILMHLSYAKAQGATNKQAKELIKASLDMAAATGKQLDSAVQQVVKTLGGFAGELAEVNPEIKTLTAEQLKAGEAAKILNRQYGGAAAAQINNYDGALQQTKNTFGDMLEQIGFLVTKNPAFVNAIKIVQSEIESLTKRIADNQEEINKWVDEHLNKAMTAFKKFSKMFKELTFEKVKEEIESVSTALNVLVTSAKVLIGLTIVSSILKIVGSIRLLTANFKAFAHDIAKGSHPIYKFFRSIRDGISASIKYVKNGISHFLKFFKTITTGIAKVAKPFIEGFLYPLKKAYSLLSQSINFLIDDFIKMGKEIVALLPKGGFLSKAFTQVTSSMTRLVSFISTNAIPIISKLGGILSKIAGGLLRFAGSLTFGAVVQLLWSDSIMKGEDALLKQQKTMDGYSSSNYVLELSNAKKANIDYLNAITSLDLNDKPLMMRGVEYEESKSPEEKNAARKLAEQKANNDILSAKNKAHLDSMALIKADHLTVMNDMRTANNEMVTLDEQLRNETDIETTVNYNEKRNRIELDALKKSHTNKKGKLIDEKKYLDAKHKLQTEQLKKEFAFQKQADAQLVTLHAARNQAIIGGVVSLGAQIMSQSGSDARTQFGITQALMIAQATASAYAASNMALAQPPGPPWTAPLAAATLSSGLINAGMIAAMTAIKFGSSKNFAEGGYVPGSSFVGDKVGINTNSGELVLTKNDQGNLLSMIRGGGGSDNTALINSINNLANRPIVLEIDGYEIAKSVKSQVEDGFVLLGAS